MEPRVEDLPAWRWPPMPTYNGFTHEERVRGWQLIHWMVDNGVMSPAKCCSVSGATDRLHFHCEDYYSPWNAYPISQPIHLALHRRFRCPEAWSTIVERHAITGDEWFCQLSSTPIDLATQLRAEYGRHVADVFGRR